MPYRIFLTDGLFYGSTQTPVKVWVDKGKVAVAGCSAALKDMTVAEKYAFKAELQQNLWKHWAKSMEFPNSFFTVSNYTVNCQASPDSPNYPRTRGFVANNGEEREVGFRDGFVDLFGKYGEPHFRRVGFRYGIFLGKTKI